MEYVAPDSIEDAVHQANHSEGSVRFLAGGTDALVQLKSGLFTPGLMIDLKNIPGMLDVVRTETGGWQIGAAVPGAKLGKIADLRKDWPGVVESMELIGSTQIQGRASLGGNLCNASPAADSVPALFAAGATVTVQASDGERVVPVSQIPVAPGKTILAKGEIVTSINLPPRRAGEADAYLRFIPRTEMDIAVVGCAVNLKREGETVTEAAIALGAVAPVVVMVPDAADAIRGSSLAAEALDEMAEACSSACRPISDKRGTVEFRIEIAAVLARRAARIAYQRAGESL